MGESAYEEKTGGAPLPVARRPVIRPVGFRSVELVTEFLIGASILQGVLFGFGAWYVNDLRREYWGASVSPIESMLLGSTDDLDGDSKSTDGLAAGGMARGATGVDADAKRVERFMGLWLQFAFLGPMFVIVCVTELVSFIVWQVRMHENVGALGSDGLRFESHGSVLSWFVPVVVLWKPMQIVQEIWRASDPMVGAGDELGWRLRPGSAIVMCWWSLLVIAKCLFWGGLVMALCHMTSILSPMALWVFALGVGGFASVPQIWIVGSTAKRQNALEKKRAGAVRKAEAAGEPIVDADAMVIRIKKRSEQAVSVGPIMAAEMNEMGGRVEACRAIAEVSASGLSTAGAAFAGHAEIAVANGKSDRQGVELLAGADGAAAASPNGLASEPLLLTEEASVDEVAIDAQRDTSDEATVDCSPDL